MPSHTPSHRVGRTRNAVTRGQALGRSPRAKSTSQGGFFKFGGLSGFQNRSGNIAFGLRNPPKGGRTIKAPAGFGSLLDPIDRPDFRVSRVGLAEKGPLRLTAADLKNPELLRRKIKVLKKTAIRGPGKDSQFFRELRGLRGQFRTETLPLNIELGKLRAKDPSGRTLFQSGREGLSNEFNQLTRQLEDAVGQAGLTESGFRQRQSGELARERASRVRSLSEEVGPGRTRDLNRIVSNAVAQFMNRRRDLLAAAQERGNLTDVGSLG